MDTRNSQFNRIVLVVLIVLFLITQGVFMYLNWQVDPDHNALRVIAQVLTLSIPLVALFGPIYVLLAGWHERSTTGQVSPGLAKVIHWAPRLAAILIIFFISLFSLDVFEMPGTLLEKLGGLLMHSLPALTLLVLLVVAWKRPVVGAAAFLLAAAAFTFFFVRDLRNLANLLLFVFPLLLVAALFYADWKWLSPAAPPPAVPAA